MSYYCGFCGKEFADIEARAKCELRCAEEIRKKKEKEEKELAELERVAAEKELISIKDLFDEKFAEYVKAYHKLPRLRIPSTETVKANEPRGNEDDFWADLISELLSEF